MATVPLDDAGSRKRIAAALQHRFFLRMHMAAILTATILVGLGVTRGLYLLHVNVFAVRYGFAVIAAYAAFIGFIKVWLWYVESCARRASARAGTSDDWFTCVNFSSGGSSSFSGSSSGLSFGGGGGGKFGGGGASGSWGGDGPDAKLPAVAEMTSRSSSQGSGSKSGSGGGGGLDSDLGELILVVLIIALVAAIILSFLWIVYAAPAILSEVVFNATLAGALARHAHQATHGEWVGGVLKKTVVPFAGVLVLSIAVGWWAQHYCPGAVRLRDAVHCVQGAS